jgi:hypothetical protein
MLHIVRFVIREDSSSFVCVIIESPISSNTTTTTTKAPLSFMADYVYMDAESVCHVLDRILAVPMMSFEVYKVSCLWYYKRHTRGSSGFVAVLLYTCCTIMAIASFLLSQQAQSRQDLPGFIVWHNRWHM